MPDANRLLFLRIALIVIGLTFIFGVYTLGAVWPSGWAWGRGHSHYLMMIIGVYGTLGVFLLIASRNPYAHKSIIWFTVWSSVVHGAIMCVQSFNDAAERGHLIGDAPALLLVAIILATLMSRIDSPFEKGATAGLMETKGFTDQRGAAHLCAQTVIWLDWLSDKSCLVQKPRLEMTDNVRRCLNLHHRA